MKKGHIGKINSLAYSSDGKRFYSASSDKTIKEWDSLTGECIKTFRGHEGSVNSVVRINEDMLASGGSDKKIKIWDISRGKSIKTRNLPAEVNTLCFSREKELLFFGGEDRLLEIRDLLLKKELSLYPEHNSSIRSISYNPHKERIAAGGWALWDCYEENYRDSYISEWDILSGQCVFTYGPVSSCVYNISYSPDGKILITGDYDGSIGLWNVETGKNIILYKAHSDSVTCFAISPDGKKIFSGSGDRTLKEWNATYECIRTYEGHRDRINTLAISPDGERMISGSSDMTVREWSVNTGECIRIYEAGSV